MTGKTLLERIIAEASPERTVPEVARVTGASYQRAYAVIRECELPFRAAKRGRPAARRNCEARVV